MRSSRRFVALVACLLLLAGSLPAADNPIVTVLDLKTDQVSESEMKTIISLLSSSLFQTGKYTVIDVSERETLLKEMEFSAQDCSSESCQLEIGKMLAAEYIVVGRLGRIGAKYVVSVKMLETVTARTVGTADGTYGELEKLIEDMEGIAGRLAGIAAAGRRAPAGRVVAGAVSLAGGVGCGVGAAVLMIAGVQYLRGPVAEAYADYLGEPDGSAAIGALYDAYVARFGGFRTRIVVGAGLAGGAVLLSGVSVLLFTLPAKGTGPAVAVEAGPWGAGVRVGVRLSW
jgi:hypothetical protein